MGYLANFMVYTLAMVGVIVVALLVFKQATQGVGIQKSKHLKVIDTLSLGSRKTLYIVSAGQEKFLIAGDVDKTNLISKLETTNTIQSVELSEKKPTTFQDTIGLMSKSNDMDYMNKSNVGIKSSMLSSQKSAEHSVIRNLANLMRG